MTCCEAEAMSSGTGVMPIRQVQDNGTSRFGTLTRKTIAEGLFDVALLMSNASQLNAILAAGSGAKFYSIILGFLITSIVLQLIVGGVLLAIATLEIKQDSGRKLHSTLNTVAVGLIGFITAVNIFITAFGVNVTNSAIGNNTL
ncbi:ninjurin-2-like isoform X3 [Liolophura sinensis]|uniref:ninjurin-2-like isoform X3 n=1 Tax=Liolophura sinensis TaxID=3198878 RepID=UPI00315943AB